MSKVLKQFEEAIFKGGLYKKLFQKQTPGKRIAPVQARDNDSKYQLRLDAGESLDGIKNVYLQVNSQAKNDSLAKFRQKKGTDANLASSTIDENTPAESQEEVARKFWEEMAKQAKENLN
ncbi:hypothetical protein EYZ11_012813 [Aspergillus tanneri]|uniref:Uncharacterized protein n=1 Tax=Aspergillus tanneri TaxID=1220188 RepID=A0A4S3IZ94_9EURO|nr:uncharacterized protein ATNIH1004_001671 [Aspergillus tanneri]KAA8652766.1 hypothetical protein ATNIH1004_001671 [Aspergillus tanneri]THC87740.1 hypothetical protein EYZ11_012813 [Aspergillus tanneri]